MTGDKVVFRIWKNGYGKGDVIALFPQIAASCGGYLCISYEHCGQHGAADPTIVIQRTRPARPQQYKELKEELERIGYNVRVAELWLKS